MNITNIIERMKEFLELTEAKITVFFILFVISFSIFGPFFSGFWSFVLFLVYTYVYSCMMGKKIENIIKKGMKVSEQQIVGYGTIHLMSILLIVLATKYFSASG